MTAATLLAAIHAEADIQRAIRVHERLALVEARIGHPLTAREHVAAAKRLRRYGPTEVVAVVSVDAIDPADSGRNDR